MNQICRYILFRISRKSKENLKFKVSWISNCTINCCDLKKKHALLNLRDDLKANLKIISGEKKVIFLLLFAFNFGQDHWLPFSKEEWLANWTDCIGGKTRIYLIFILILSVWTYLVVLKIMKHSLVISLIALVLAFFVIASIHVKKNKA